MEEEKEKKKRFLLCTSESKRNHQQWLEAINVYGIFGNM